VWDTRTGAELACLRGHDGALMVATFSPEGARVVTGAWDATARIWDARTGAEIARLSGHQVNWVNTAVFSADGTRILTGSTDGTARVWDAGVGTETGRLVAQTPKTSADCTRIAAAAPDNCVSVWDVETGEVVACLEDGDATLSPVAFSDDHARIAVMGGDGVVRVFDVATEAMVGRLQGRVEQINGAVFSADGARLLTHAMEGENYYVRVWDVASGAQMASQSMWARDDRFTCAALSPDGQRFAVSLTGPSLGVYDVSSGRAVGNLRGHGEGEMQSIAFSADSARIVTASSDRSARIWDAATGAQIACLTHSDKVSSAAFSADGVRVVTASHDNTARVWDAATGAELLCLKGHDNWVRSAKFSADGGHIITASWDQSVRIWDAASGAEIACLPGMESPVIDAAISRHAGRIVTSVGNVTRIWDAARIAALAGPAAPVLAASLTNGRGLSFGSEREDLLMQAAPNDLHAALMERLTEADQEAALLRSEVLARPSHRNCYLPADLQPVWQAGRRKTRPMRTSTDRTAAPSAVIHEPSSIDRTSASAPSARRAHHPLIAPALVITVAGIGASVLYLLVRVGVLKIE
jgi:WD40 repeat protein